MEIDMKGNVPEKFLVEILIVEDSPTQAEGLKYTLERHDFVVSIARNGIDALSCIRERRPTMVISDILMPEMDGYQLCRVIKNDDSLKDLPVILLTALSDPLDVIKGLECGADNFITKPYKEACILSRVQYILANRHLMGMERTQLGVEVILDGENFFIKSDRIQILNLLFSSYEAAIQKNEELVKTQAALKLLNEQLEQKVEEQTASLLEEIRERKQAEEEIRNLAAIVESSEDAIISKNLEGIILSWNAGAEHLYGYSAQEATGRSASFLTTRGDYDKSLQILEKIRRGERVEPNETRRIRKDGTVIEVSMTVSPITGAVGKLVGASVIARDITERKQAELAIVNAKEEWERTFDAIIDPIMIVDLGYRIVKANRAMADKLGLTSAGATDLVCYRAVHGVDAPPPYCPYAQFLADGLPHLVEIHEPRIGGYFFVSGSPLRDPGGKLYGCVCTYRDITERKNLENQLHQAQKMEAIGTLAGGVAHDFNNILTAIIGFGSLTQMKMAQDDPLLVNVNHILRAAERAATLTRSLLAFSRKELIERKPVNLFAIVKGVEKMLSRLIREDIELKISISGGELMVLADAGQIEQVLMNLTTNARDAMDTGGTIAISIDRVTLDEDFRRAHGFGEPGSYALLCFVDSGEGIEGSIRERIFEPFFTTKEVDKGTGLGLSVCYGIIKQHDGYIDCNSELGKGTTFRIFLPLIRAVAERPESTPVVPLTGGMETILVAEDDPAVRTLTTAILQEFGYSVIEARDGEEAVARFRERQREIDLCLFDVIMPKKKGWEAYAEIRIISPEVRVLFMSGYQADVYRQSGLLKEGAAFIDKPVMPRLLLQKVRELLDK